MKITTLNLASVAASPQLAPLSSAQTSQPNDSYTDIANKLNEIANEVDGKFFSSSDPNWNQEQTELQDILDYLTTNVDPIKNQLPSDVQDELNDIEQDLQTQGMYIYYLSGQLLASTLRDVANAIAALPPPAPEQKSVSQRLISAKL